MKNFKLISLLTILLTSTSQGTVSKEVIQVNNEYSKGPAITDEFILKDKASVSLYLAAQQLDKEYRHKFYEMSKEYLNKYNKIVSKHKQNEVMKTMKILYLPII